MAGLKVDRSLAYWREAERLIPAGSQTLSKRPVNYAMGAYPIYASRAEGCHIWDVDGNEYIDYVLGLGPITLGYCYPRVDAAIREQLAKGIIYGLISPLEIEAAKAVCESVPCAEMVRFLKSGCEVTSAAVRIARAYTKREKVATTGYHGWHDTWTAARNDGGVPKVLSEYVLPFGYNDLESLEKIFKAHPGEIAAVVMDPASTKMPKPGFLEGVRRLATTHGAVLIYDEIVTGFRMALGGGQEYFKVVPDLACFAKGMANGMPVAAVVGRAEVMKCAEKLVISVTYGGEALSLAAIVAAIAEYREKDVFPFIWRQGEKLMAGMNKAAQSHGFPPMCVGFAPMSGMALTHENPKLVDKMWYFFLAECAKRGVLMRRGGLNFITYSHSDGDIARTVAAVDETLAEMRRALDSGKLNESSQYESCGQRLSG